MLFLRWTNFFLLSLVLFRLRVPGCAAGASQPVVPLPGRFPVSKHLPTARTRPNMIRTGETDSSGVVEQGRAGKDENHIITGPFAVPDLENATTPFFPFHTPQSTYHDHSARLSLSYRDFSHWSGAAHPLPSCRRGGLLKLTPTLEDECHNDRRVRVYLDCIAGMSVVYGCTEKNVEGWCGNYESGQGYCSQDAQIDQGCHSYLGRVFPTTSLIHCHLRIY
ncbi:hypothetical protein QBC35DRAFT_93205 [Podospora australis]|uniref:Cyanovirin-N domain-containing protein n=1 Tax=Podospora australis TaxID=1536484 RepID=A0AAN6WK49_9PEZI|nr:hypothetical protein QBC35DRAFT_93205 [Podospora australis]